MPTTDERDKFWEQMNARMAEKLTQAKNDPILRKDRRAAGLNDNTPTPARVELWCIARWALLAFAITALAARCGLL